MIRIYNRLLAFYLVPTLPLLALAAVISKKRRKTVLPRLGLGTPPVAGNVGRSVWVHALSVGEVRSALPLVRALAAPFGAERIIVSVATHTGYLEARRILGAQVRDVVYSPYDLPWAVRRVAGRIDPMLVIVVESDIWPNFMHEMGRRQIPVVLVNARLSDRSLSGYRRLGRFGRDLFGGFSAVCTQSREEARRFLQLGMNRARIHVTGSTKFDQVADPVDPAGRQSLRRDLGLARDARVLVAGSTHRGEEAQIALALGGIRRSLPGAVLVVAPRDPQRAAEVRRVFQKAGFQARPLSEAARSTDRAPEVVVVDRLGLLARLYALADLAYVGGSLVAEGGHNPLEPAALAKPVLFGPDMGDFRRIAQRLLDAGGARRIRDAAELAEQAEAIFRQPETAARMGRAAERVFREQGGAVSRILAVIEAIVTGADRIAVRRTRRGGKGAA